MADRPSMPPAASATQAPPFPAARLDALMEEAGLDVLVATSKHNIRYLTGGHRYFFFDYMDAIGVSRYLPVLVYVKGRPDAALYVPNRSERDAIAVHAAERGGFWAPVGEGAWGTLDAMDTVIAHLRKLGLIGTRVGAELGFLPADAAARLGAALGGNPIGEALRPLERLRAVKTPQELELLREASDRVVEAMLAVIADHGPGTTKHDLVEALRREEVARGLQFEYCLLAAGSSHNRAPSAQVLREGDILSIDSGGNYRGYIGDLSRMAILGTPDAELEDLLAEVDAVQQAARSKAQAGITGRDLYAAAEAVIAASPSASLIRFVAHGMGLISHEAPRLTATGPVPYPASDADLPLEAGMVLSIETTIPHPRRGFIKLEDTVAVGEGGSTGFGDAARGWNRGRSGGGT